MAHEYQLKPENTQKSKMKTIILIFCAFTTLNMHAQPIQEQEKNKIFLTISINKAILVFKTILKHGC